MRLALKTFRVSKNLTQKQMAEKTGVSISTYSLIESGTRRGSQEFWQRLQKEFDLDGGTVWALQNETI